MTKLCHHEVPVIQTYISTGYISEELLVYVLDKLVPVNTMIPPESTRVRVIEFILVPDNTHDKPRL